ncbi:thiosulfate oxidation carrier protein SoxY [Bradyrhizobium sp. Leo170]|uniref:thiosulfate oxidation carrier protein SoxY n=1 Tax=Bradyrhizobium sp. Leo170 TaxID=1571199 RepID=UPI0013EE6DAA|nr:thiosulfate oxidation carrier protein SoxY [Bradyrhizobium sp. Leo170]
MTRRQKLSAFLGALGMAVLGRSAVAHADQAAVNLLIGQFADGKTPVVGRVKLGLPPATEEGSAVEVSVSVDVPPGAYVTDVLVVADGNEKPAIVTFHFFPMSVVEATTRIRLAAGEQHVTAVARLNDRSCYAATEKVTVAKTGCV